MQAVYQDIQDTQEEALMKLLHHAVVSRRQDCLDSFFTFVEIMWPTVCVDQFVYNFHIEYICKELQKVSVWLIARQPKKYDLIINIPPGETKTIVVLQLFPVWLWLHDDSMRIISSSHSQHLSYFSAMKSKDCIESELFAMIFEPIIFKENMNGVGHYMTQGGGERLATSVGSKIIGFHAHLRLLDDLVDATAMDSLAQIDAAKRHMDALSSRSTDEKVTTNIMIMQRIAVNDPTAYALEKWSRVKHIKLPAEDSFEISPPAMAKFYVDGLLNPNRKPHDILVGKKEELGTLKYNAQYGQKTESLDGKQIQPWMFNIVSEMEFQASLSAEDFKSFLASKKYATADLAYTSKKKGDPSGVLVFKYWNSFLYLLDFFEWRKEAPELLSAYVQLDADEELDRSWIENKASGMSIAQMLRKKEVNAIDYIQVNVDKPIRMLSHQGFLESRRIVVIVNIANQKRINKFLDQLYVFPDNTVPDEGADTLEMALSLIKSTKRKWT